MLILWFPTLPVLSPSLWGSSQTHQLQLILPVPWCSIVFLVLSLFDFFDVFSVVCRDDKVHYSAGSYVSHFNLFIYSFFFSHTSGLLSGIKWSVCISKSQRILCVSFSRTDSLELILHIPFGNIIKFQFLARFSVDQFPRTVVSSLFALDCCIQLTWD